MAYRDMVLRAVMHGALLLGFVGAPTIWALEVGDRVDNFRLMDHSGGSSELYYFADVKAVAVMAHNSRCAQAAGTAQGLQALQNGLAADHLQVLLVNSDLLDRRDDILGAVAASALQTPVLMDTTQIIGESLGLTAAGEVLVIDPKGWRLAYRGDIDGAHQAIAQRTGVSASATAQSAAPVGDAANCTIDYPEIADRSQHANISYAETIAPMLAENCVSCVV